MKEKARQIINKIKEHKKDISIISVIVVLLLSFYSLMLPEIINVNQYRNELLEIAEQKIKGKLDFGEIKLGLPVTGGIVIKTDYIKLVDKNGQPLLSGENVKLKVAILPLIFRDAVIKNLEVDNLEAFITREKELRFNIEDYIPPAEPDDIVFIRLKGTRAHLKNYNVKITDTFIKPSKTFVLKGKSFQLLNFTENKTLKFKTQGDLNDSVIYNILLSFQFPLKEDFFQNRYTLKGRIKNLRIPLFKEYLPVKDITGILDSKFNIKQHRNKLSISTKNSVKEAINIPEYDLNIQSGYLKLKTLISKNKIEVEEIETTINKIDSTITGTIKDWQKDNPAFKLGIKLSNSNIKRFLGTIPSIEQAKDILFALKKYNLSGTTNADIKIHGTLKAPEFFGVIRIDNYQLDLAKNVTIKNIQSTFQLERSKITARNFLIPLTGGDILQINGSYDIFKNRFHHLRISSTILDLKELQRIIIPLLNTLKIPDSMLKNTLISGKTHLNLSLNGPIEKPFINGWLSLSADTLNINGFTRSLKNIAGKILFKGSEINIETLNIELEKNSTVNISGIADFHKEIAKEITIKGSNTNLSQLQNMLIVLAPQLKLPQEDLRKLKISGTTKYDITLKGPIKDINPYGTATLSNVKVESLEINAPIQNINGQLKFDKVINIQNLTGLIENNIISITGMLNPRGNSNIDIQLKDFQLKDIQNLALKTEILKPEEEETLKQASLHGSLSGLITIKADNHLNISPEAHINMNESSITHPDLPDTVNIASGTLNLINDKIELSKLIFTTGGSTFNISGSLDEISKGLPEYQVEATSNKITLDLIKKLGQHSSSPASFRELISSVSNTTGNVSLHFKAENKGFEVTADLDKLSIYTNHLQHPIRDIYGKIILSDSLMSFDRVKLHYGDSGINLNGNIDSLNQSPVINISIDGDFSPVDFSEFLEKDFRDKFILSNHIVFNGYAKGNLNRWDLFFETFVPAGTQLAYKGSFNIPENTPLKLLIDGRGTRESVKIEKILLQFGESEFNAAGAFEYSEENLITIDDLHIKIPIINLDEFNKFLEKGLLTDNLSGDISSNLKISGPVLNPDITGFINLDNITLPMLKVLDLDLDLELSGQDAEINRAHINVNGIIFEIKSHINNFKRFPIELTNLYIHSPSLRLTDLISSASSGSQQIDSLPFIVKSGYISIDDAIIDKLITTNLTGNISLCPSGLFQITNMSLNTAGGTARGDIYVNVIKETLGAQLQIIGVKANAAATILLDLPNEIFGDLNATIVFDSQGTDYDKILENAEASASLIINNGRFTRLGTLEHLLTATNIITGGLGGINLNNILASIIPMHTGNFERLSGDFTVREGVLNTNNLITRGKNLSLEISGDFNIATELADLNVKGYLSRNVSGLLGPLGRLNLHTITDFIPGLGFIPGTSSKRGLLDFIPGLGFIPGFGGPKTNQKIRNFAVEIQGNLYDMSSVKNFRWTE
jgi:hypothetical protein